MEEIKRILVVSRDTWNCRRAVHYGVSLARTYGAKLFVIHVVHNPFGLRGWNLPMPLPVEKEYQRLLHETRREIAAIVDAERKKGVRVKQLVRAGDPQKEIFKTVKAEDIDLLVMLAHEEGDLEHFLFGRSNEEIVRRMPCSVLLVKKEPGLVK